MEEEQIVPESNEKFTEKEIALEQMIRECMDSPGYIAFIGCMSRDRDKDGNNLINFKYRRFNFSFEDTRKAVEEFAKAYRKDIDAT